MSQPPFDFPWVEYDEIGKLMANAGLSEENKTLTQFNHDLKIAMKELNIQSRHPNQYDCKACGTQWRSPAKGRQNCFACGRFGKLHVPVHWNRYYNGS